MTDGRTLFRDADAIAAPDLWREISARAAETGPDRAWAPPPRHGSRVVVAVAALLLSALAIGVAIRVLRPAGDGRPAAPQRWGIVDRIHIGDTAFGVTALDASIWVSSERGLLRVDPATGLVVATIDAPDGTLVTSGGSVWVLGGRGVVKVDPATGAKTETSLRSVAESAVGAGFGSVWVGQYKGSVIRRVDGTTGEITPTDTNESWPIGLAATADAMWVASLNGVVQQIDPTTNEIVRIVDLRRELGIDTSALGIVADGDSVWVTACAGASRDAFGMLRGCSWSMNRIDGMTGAVTDRVELGGSQETPTADGVEITLDGVRPLAVADGSLWVAANDYRFVGTGYPYQIDEGEEGSVVNARLIRIDPITGEMLEPVGLDGAIVHHAVATQGVLWIVDTLHGDLLRIAPTIASDR